MKNLWIGSIVQDSFHFQNLVHFFSSGNCGTWDFQLWGASRIEVKKIICLSGTAEYCLHVLHEFRNSVRVGNSLRAMACYWLRVSLTNSTSMWNVMTTLLETQLSHPRQVFSYYRCICNCSGLLSSIWMGRHRWLACFNTQKFMRKVCRLAPIWPQSLIYLQDLHLLTLQAGDFSYTDCEFVCLQSAL